MAAALDMLSAGKIIGKLGAPAKRRLNQALYSWILEKALKGTAIEAGTEGLQEAIGAAFEKDLADELDTFGNKEDAWRILNAVATGAIGGFAAGGAFAPLS